MDTNFATATQIMNVAGAALESSRTGKDDLVPCVQQSPERASRLRGAPSGAGNISLRPDAG